MNKHMPNKKVPSKDIVCALLSVSFVYVPLRQISLREPLLIIGNSAIISNGVLALSAGVICGFLLSDKFRPLAAIIGGLSTCSGSVLYTYYCLNNAFSLYFDRLAIFLFLGVTIGIGVLVYQLVLNASEGKT